MPPREKIPDFLFLWGFFCTFAWQTEKEMDINISESRLREAACHGSEAFLSAVHDAVLEAVGGEVNGRTLPLLGGEQTTLLAYFILRREVMEGGFIQLIHNGYGPFIFLNPFAKAMRLWGAHDLGKLIYKGRRLFEQYGDRLTEDCTDEEFMALYEQYPAFDDLDDDFIDMEEEATDIIAHYVDGHLNQFVIPNP